MSILDILRRHSYMSILHPHNVPFQQPTICISVQDSRVVFNIIMWRGDAALNNHSTIRTCVFSIRVYLDSKKHRSTRSQNITTPHNLYTSQPTSYSVKGIHNAPHRPSTATHLHTRIQTQTNLVQESSPNPCLYYTRIVQSIHHPFTSTFEKSTNQRIHSAAIVPMNESAFVRVALSRQMLQKRCGLRL